MDTHSGAGHVVRENKFGDGKTCLQFCIKPNPTLTCCCICRMCSHSVGIIPTRISNRTSSKSSDRLCRFNPIPPLAVWIRSSHITSRPVHCRESVDWSSHPPPRALGEVLRGADLVGVHAQGRQDGQVVQADGACRSPPPPEGSPRTPTPRGPAASHPHPCNFTCQTVAFSIRTGEHYETNVVD